jgi:RimJ/RimL family protein N-acetyltransferase
MDAPLRRHGVVLRDGNLVLRPMTEHDWPLLARVTSRTDVLRWTDGAGAAPWDWRKTQQVYRAVSRDAYCFIIKWRGAEIGECWLQRMNLEVISRRYPQKDLRRIDIAILQPALWSHGIGTRAISLLVRFGFEREAADGIFGIVLEENGRSRRAFEKCGFSLDQTFALDAGGGEVHMVRWRN